MKWYMRWRYDVQEKEDLRDWTRLPDRKVGLRVAEFCSNAFRLWRCQVDVGTQLTARPRLILFVRLSCVAAEQAPTRPSVFLSSQIECATSVMSKKNARSDEFLVSRVGSTRDWRGVDPKESEVVLCCCEVERKWEEGWPRNIYVRISG